MARSPLTLAAAATVAVPAAEYMEATALTAGGEGRFDAALLTERNGSRSVVRIPLDPAIEADLATEALALQALSQGARALLPFAVPEFLGAGPHNETRVFVRSFVPGFLVDAAHIPPGLGLAASLGEAIAAVHTLPISVVRSAGLPVRSADDVRSEARRISEQAGATGRVPVRLMVRWREVIEDAAVWQFEPTVTLGGADAGAYVYTERGGVPSVAGIIDWHGLQVSDPALDLRFLTAAPAAEDTVHAAYAAALHRAPDEMMRLRARLHAELDFARWLLHGRDTHQDAVLEDATALLDSLAEGIRDTDLKPQQARAGMDEALAALQATPHAAATADTSMQTDAFAPDEFALLTEAVRADQDRTQDLTAEVPDRDPADPDATQPYDPMMDDAERPAEAPAEAAQQADGAAPVGAEPAHPEPVAAEDPDGTQPFDPVLGRSDDER